MKRTYITITTEEGEVLDRFAIALDDSPQAERMEDVEVVGHPISNADTCDRIRRAVAQYTKGK